jgi:hypothetical protein
VSNKKSALQRMSEFDGCPLREQTGFTIPNGETLRMKLNKKYSQGSPGGYARGVAPLKNSVSWNASYANHTSAYLPPPLPPAPAPYHQYTMRHCLHCDGYHEPVRVNEANTFQFRDHIKLNPIDGSQQPCLGSGLRIGQLRVKCTLCAETFVTSCGLDNHEVIFAYHAAVPPHFDGAVMCMGPVSVVLGSQ